MGAQRLVSKKLTMSINSAISTDEFELQNAIVRRVSRRKR